MEVCLLIDDLVFFSASRHCFPFLHCFTLLILGFFKNTFAKPLSIYVYPCLEEMMSCVHVVISIIKITPRMSGSVLQGEVCYAAPY